MAAIEQAARHGLAHATEPDKSGFHFGSPVPEILSTSLPGFHPAIDADSMLQRSDAFPCGTSSWLRGSSPHMTRRESDSQMSKSVQLN
jgi:hypothetical protein